MRSYRTVLAGAVLAGVTLAVNAEAPADDNKPMPLCGVINAVLQEHGSGFESLRGARSKSRYTTIWKAKYDVVGSGCEVWQWGGGNMNYVCTQSAPSKAVADEYYQQARTEVRGCLGPQWSEKETEREGGDGMRTVFGKAGSKPVVAIHEIKVKGIFRDQWTVYYVAGDSSEAL